MTDMEDPGNNSTSSNAKPRPNLGQIAEDWIEQICASTFLADFTVRSPKYQKSGGQTKEAADVLVVFGGTLMVIQVKTKLVDGVDVVLSPLDTSRAASAVNKALMQLRAMIEAADDPNFFTFTNARGHELKVDKTEISGVVALIVYGLVTSDGQFYGTRLQFSPSCYPGDAVPVHLFSIEEFRLLALLADTFPDFLVFLDTRAVLHENGLIHRYARSEDIWAFLTFEPERLLLALKNKTVVDIDGVHERHLEAMRRWEEAEKPSYFVDWLIDNLYAGIGGSVVVNQQLAEKAKMLAQPCTVDAVRSVIPRLAKLRRRDRTELAAGFAQKIESAQGDGMAFRIFKFEEHEEAFLVAAIDLPRSERQVVLFNLTRAAAYKIGARYVVGVASAPLPLGATDCDVILVDAKDMVIDQPLIEAANSLFGKPQEIMRPSTTSPVG